MVKHALHNKRVTDCTAEGLKLALCEYLDSKGVIQDGDYSALMGLGTDGASVMVGCHNGVGAKLKEKKWKTSSGTLCSSQTQSSSFTGQ